MKITARGMLRHYFHGNYSATVALMFDSPEEAAAALPRLGEGWEIIAGSPATCIWQGGTDALKAVKAKFASEGFKLTVDCGLSSCKGKCRDASIDSLAHSVDFGPPFEVEIDGCIDMRQATLAL
jgi:sugar phosphate isomerase/epimerase